MPFCDVPELSSPPVKITMSENSIGTLVPAEKPFLAELIVVAIGTNVLVLGLVLGTKRSALARAVPWPLAPPAIRI